MISSPTRKSRAIEQVRRENDALLLTAPRGTLRLSPVSDSILRVTYTEQAAFSEEIIGNLIVSMGNKRTLHAVSLHRNILINIKIHSIPNDY